MINSLLILTLCLSALGALIYFFKNQIPSVLLGLVDKDDYLEHRLGPYYRAMQSVNELEGAPSVLSLWEARGLYCTPVCTPDVWISRWYVTYYAAQDPDKILDAWRSQGFTHVLLNDVGMLFTRAEDQRYSPAAWDTLDRVLQELEVAEDVGGIYRLYELDH